jgi:CRP-like cAMP-binding protein
MTLESRLAGNALLRSFSREEVERLEAFAAVKTYGLNEIIYQGEQVASLVFVLLDGAVQLQLPASSGGITLRVARVACGELFGIAPLIGLDRYSTGARATEASDVLAIQADPLRALLDQNPAAAARVYQRVAQSCHDRSMQALLSLQGLVDQLQLSV